MLHKRGGHGLKISGFAGDRTEKIAVTADAPTVTSADCRVWEIAMVEAVGINPAIGAPCAIGFPKPDLFIYDLLT